MRSAIAIACMALSAAARLALAEAKAAAARQYLDSEVIASLKPALVAWRDAFNSRNASNCGAMYQESASLYVELGPMAQLFASKVSLPNPAIMRGKAAISEYWDAAINKVGLKNLQMYGDKGRYSPTIFIVGDDQAIVECRFAFTGAEGHATSESWQRIAGVWKIGDAMHRFGQADPSAIRTAFVMDPSEKKDSVSTNQDLKNVTPVSDAFINVTGLKTPTFFVPIATAPQGGSSFFYVTASIIVGSCIAAAVLHYKRRQGAARSFGGPDIMLG